MQNLQDKSHVFTTEITSNEKETALHSWYRKILWWL